MAIQLKALESAHLDEFKKLLGSLDFGGCYCAVWTAYGQDWEARCADKSAPNFSATAERVKNGHHAGYFVYDADVLVGWTGSGPKTCFPLLESKLGSRLSPSNDETWSIGCIAVKSEFRGRGLADKIISAIVEIATKSDATKIEAYPVSPFHEPRVYRGTDSLYRRQGFTEVSSDNDGNFRILLMRKDLLKNVDLP